MIGRQSARESAPCLRTQVSSWDLPSACRMVTVIRPLAVGTPQLQLRALRHTPCRRCCVDVPDAGIVSDFGSAERAESATLTCGGRKRDLLRVEVAGPAQRLRARGADDGYTSPPWRAILAFRAGSSRRIGLRRRSRRLDDHDICYSRRRSKYDRGRCAPQHCLRIIQLLVCIRQNIALPPHAIRRSGRVGFRCALALIMPSFHRGQLIDWFTAAIQALRGAAAAGGGPGAAAPRPRCGAHCRRSTRPPAAHALRA